MTAWHDLSLNWEYPPDPGPWDVHEYERFEATASALGNDLQSELGGRFSIVYEQLGSCDGRADSE